MAPTAAQFRETAEFFDMTFKFEVLIDSLTEIFRMTSGMEFMLFFVAVIFFFTGLDRSTWYGILALFHVARAFIGVAMQRVIPSSYDFVEKLEFIGKGPVRYSSVKQELTLKVKKLLVEYYDDFEKLPQLQSEAQSILQAFLN